jgi:nicotinamide mononucleotide (NMN) deamidase PncC
VIFGLARRDGPCHTERHVFPGDRTAVRDPALKVALGLLAGAAKT